MGIMKMLSIEIILIILVTIFIAFVVLLSNLLRKSVGFTSRLYEYIYNCQTESEIAKQKIKELNCQLSYLEAQFKDLKNLYDKIKYNLHLLE